MIVYRELSSLERDLGFAAKTLYSISNNLSKHYHSVQIPKRTGGVRSLSVPDEVLKAIQRRITAVLLLRMPVSFYAKAYKDCSSVLKNASPHIGKSVVLKLDILHFFDSIQYSQVKEKAFPSTQYSEPIRILLTMLCYHGNALPQGAPSSPTITNIILYSFDELIGAWCREQNIDYTRYCDDMTFSGDFDPQTVIDFVRTELKQLGFLLNNQKTKILRTGSQQIVTGIVVNEKLHVPSDYRRKLRQEIYFCQKYGIDDHMQRCSLSVPKDKYLQQLLGRVNYVLQIDPDDSFMQSTKRWLLQAQQRA